MQKRLLTASDVRRLKEEGTLQVTLAADDLITALALDAAQELGVEIEYETTGAARLPVWSGASQRARREAGSARDSPPRPVPAPPPELGQPAAQSDDLEERVRQIVTTLVEECHPPAAATPVRHIPGRGTKLEPFPFDVGRPEMDIRLLDVVTAEHGSPIGGGLMSFRQGSFPWTLEYEEIDYVIEGELHIGTKEGTVIGQPGDVLYIPKGTSITFGTPEWVKFFYVTYPADWGG